MNQECINKWLLFADRSHFFQSEKQINAALEYSEHKLRSRSLLSMLTNGKLFVKEKGFEELLPVYDISALDIQEYIKAKLLESKNVNI